MWLLDHERRDGSVFTFAPRTVRVVMNLRGNSVEQLFLFFNVSSRGPAVTSCLVCATCHS